MSSPKQTEIDLPESLRPLFLAMSPYQQRAALLVLILNAAADPSFKSRYARRWWGIVEERVKLGAMMSEDLIRWSSSVSSRLGGSVGKNPAHRRSWDQLIRAGEDSRVLDALQHDTPALIAFVRAYQDVRREVFEAEVAFERGEELTPEQEALL